MGLSFLVLQASAQIDDCLREFPALNAREDLSFAHCLTDPHVDAAEDARAGVIAVTTWPPR